MFSDGQQVFAVPGNEHVDLGFDGAGEDQIVIRIAGQWFGFLRRCLLRSDCGIGEQRSNLLEAFDGESELFRKDPDEFDRYGLEQNQVQVAVNCLFDDSTWWSSGDEGGHQDVGVAGNARPGGHSERS